MQLYRGMDVGTAKLTPAERQGIPHHLLDVWHVRQPATVVAYQQLCRVVFDDLLARGVIPVLVGGSGLYLRATLDRLEFPGTDPTLRAELQAALAADGPGQLHARLAATRPRPTGCSRATASASYAPSTSDQRNDRSNPGSTGRQVRLVVRRVRPTPSSQLALFTGWDYHAFITDRDLHWPSLRPTIAGTRSSSRPSPSSSAPGSRTCPPATSWPTPAWLALTVMAHHLGRAVGSLAGADLERATAATLRRKVFTMPGRLVHSGRRRHLPLPAGWPWANAITSALNSVQAIPPRC